MSYLFTSESVSKGIIDKFDLFSVQLTDTTNYGHFGKSHLPWEQTDLDIKL